MTDSTLPPLPKAVAWQKAIRRSDEDGDCIIGWDYCWNEYEFNVKVSGAGTASAGLPGYTAGDNTE